MFAEVIYNHGHLYNRYNRETNTMWG